MCMPHCIGSIVTHYTHDVKYTHTAACDAIVIEQQQNISMKYFKNDERFYLTRFFNFKLKFNNVHKLVI